MEFDDESNSSLCEFYEKTGACPNQEICIKSHRQAPLSRTIILHHIYPDPEIFINSLPPNTLVLDPVIRQRLVDAVFLDVSVMLMEFGILDDMVIAGNTSDNLFGNIIAIYHEFDSAFAAKEALDGQYYAGRKISVSLSPVSRISRAICNMNNGTNKCILGSSCNFIHPLEPSPHIFNQVFPRGIKSYPEKFRNIKKRYLDSPNDALYGRTKYLTNEQQSNL